MFAAPRKIISKSLFIASLLLPGITQADSNFATMAQNLNNLKACITFLNAQDYARAENEAKQFLQRGALDRVDELYAQICLGRTYDGMGRVQDALLAFQRAETLSKTTNELAVTYNWLGLTYTNLNDLDRAELYDQRALKAFRELGNKQSEAVMLNNLAMIADGRGDTERALKLYREALAMQPKSEQATTLNNIALIHHTRKEYKQALKLFRQAIEIGRNNGDTHSTAKSQINLGSSLHGDKQYTAAEKELLAGLNSIRLVGDKSWEASACEALGNLTSDKNNPKKNDSEARQWLEKAEAIYREIGDTASAEKIANLLAGK